MSGFKSSLLAAVAGSVGLFAVAPALAQTPTVSAPSAAHTTATICNYNQLNYVVFQKTNADGSKSCEWTPIDGAPSSLTVNMTSGDDTVVYIGNDAGNTITCGSKTYTVGSLRHFDYAWYFNLSINTYGGNDFVSVDNDLNDYFTTYFQTGDGADIVAFKGEARYIQANASTSAGNDILHMLAPEIDGGSANLGGGNDTFVLWTALRPGYQWSVDGSTGTDTVNGVSSATNISLTSFEVRK